MAKKLRNPDESTHSDVSGERPVVREDLAITEIRERLKEATQWGEIKFTPGELAGFLFSELTDETLEYYYSCGDEEQDACMQNDTFKHALLHAYQKASEAGNAKLQKELTEAFPEVFNLNWGVTA